MKKAQTKAPSIFEVWKKELAAAALPVEVVQEPVAMVFDGLPCKVRPLDMSFYVRSGRMPAHLARLGLHVQNGDQVAAEKALEAVPVEDIIAGQQFQRMAICRVLDEPRVVDARPEAAAEGEVSYMTLAEKRPAFVDALLLWILVGCPVPKKEGEGEGLDAEALGNFPQVGRGAKRSRTRGDGKAHGSNAVAASSK